MCSKLCVTSCRVLQGTLSDLCGALQAQQISLNYHCKCEQWVHFASGGFFNFNGTAGMLNSYLIHLFGPVSAQSMSLLASLP